MIRVLAEYVVPLILPTAIYFVVQYWLQRRAAAGAPVTLPRWWEGAPWPWLVAAGVVLLAISLGVVAIFSGAPPGEVYRPAEIRDGRVAPGEFDAEPSRPVR